VAQEVSDTAALRGGSENAKCISGKTVEGEHDDGW